MNIINKALVALALMLAASAVTMPLAGALPAIPALSGCNQPFLLGGEIAGPPALAWSMPPWAFGPRCGIAEPPVFFNARGFGFPMTIGNLRIGVIPSAR